MEGNLNTIEQALLEKLRDEMQRVTDNVMDPNTEAKAKRSVTIKLVISPLPDRTLGTVELSATSKVQAARGFAAKVFFGRDRAGQCHASEQDPQMPLFDAKPEPTASNVTTLQAKKEAK